MADKGEEIVVDDGTPGQGSAPAVEVRCFDF